MEKLLEQAKKFLDENLQVNEVELSDGINRVKMVRVSPVGWYSSPYIYYLPASQSIYPYPIPNTY